MATPHLILHPLKPNNNLFKNKLLYWLVTGVILFILVWLKYMRPYVIVNEVLYLLPHFDFLTSWMYTDKWNFINVDWTLSQPRLQIHILFQMIMDFMWFTTDNLLFVLVTIRVLLWILIITALLLFFKRISIVWVSALVGLAIWLLTGQGLMAGEWVVGGAEHKVFSYAFVLFGLIFIFNKNSLWSGICFGLACAFHVLVGFWSTLALFFTIVVMISQSHFSVRQLINFSAGVALFALPSLILLLYSMLTMDSSISEPVTDIDNIKELVITRNPHHLDPFYFIHRTQFVKAAIMLILLPLLIRTVLPKDTKQLVLYFSLFLIVFFILGLTARFFDFYSFLTIYPFRVFDLFIPLLFWVLLIEYILRFSYENWKVPFFKTSIKLKHIYIMIFILTIVSFNFFGTSHPIKQMYGRLSSIENMREYNSKPFGISTWINKNTPNNAIFQVNPCAARFWLEAKRAMVVAYKATGAKNYSQWHTRMQDMNGAAFNAGRIACGEIKSNYNNLSKEQIISNKNKYGADYYLSDNKRIDLSEHLIHSDGGYFLYKF